MEKLTILMEIIGKLKILIVKKKTLQIIYLNQSVMINLKGILKKLVFLKIKNDK